MDDKLFVPYLKELADKYSAAKAIQVELKPGEINLQCDKGHFSFLRLNSSSSRSLEQQ